MTITRWDVAELLEPRLGLPCLDREPVALGEDPRGDDRVKGPLARRYWR